MRMFPIPAGMVLSLILLPLFSETARAQEAICAKVTMQISQEATLTRQAFEARLQIDNTLSSNLTDVSANLLFTDENGNPVAVTTSGSEFDGNATVKFYYRTTNTFGEVAGNSTATLTWLIIPTTNAYQPPGESTLYFIGATLQYTLAGQSETVEVTPDYIHVKPQPSLVIEYFLPEDVAGDDAFTPQQELPIPYTLGVRVQNTGYGPARNLSVSSGQPEITDNRQGLKAAFAIVGSSVNDAPATADTTLRIGDIGVNQTAMGRWTMTSDLSGSFTKFTASINHADELGGVVTSLFTSDDGNVLTRSLLGNVQDDQPGRDTLSDFLAYDQPGAGAVLKLYSSQLQDASGVLPNNGTFVVHEVDDGNATLSNNTVTGTSMLPGYNYLEVADPSGGQFVIDSVERNDGKRLLPANAWLSTRHEETSPGAQAPFAHNHYLQIFDHVPSGGSYAYTVAYGTAALVNRPPVFAPLSVVFLPLGGSLTLPVSATDPDGNPVTLSALGMPAGATFQQNTSAAGLANATFAYTDTSTTPGIIPLTFTAYDGVLSDRATIRLFLGSPSALFDGWSDAYGLSGENALRGADPDGDGFANLFEYALGLDPTQSSMSNQPVISKVEINGKHYLQVVYVRRDNAAALGLDIDVIGTSDIHADSSTWTTPSNETITTDNLPPGFERATVLDSISLEDSATQQRHLRIRVEMTQ